MALKPYRRILDSEISFFMNHTAERGGVVCALTAGSGNTLDQSQGAVNYSATSSGKLPMGYLACDVVDVDLSRYHLNKEKNEIQKGGKVELYTVGVVETNMLKSGITFAVGDKAYLDTDGRITNVNTGAAASPHVGKIESIKDSDGYLRVSFNFLK
jgi:hypothetical protein